MQVMKDKPSDVFQSLYRAAEVGNEDRVQVSYVNHSISVADVEACWLLTPIMQLLSLRVSHAGASP